MSFQWSGQHIQRAIAAAAQSTADLTVAAPANVTAGNLLVVHLTWFGAGSISLTLSDTLTNAFTLVGSQDIITGGLGGGQALYYCANCLGGADTFTFHSASNLWKSMEIVEYPGLATTTLDQTAAAVANTATPNSGNVTPTQAGELYVGAFSHSSVQSPAVVMPAADWMLGLTQIPVSNNAGLIYADKIGFDTSAVAASLTLAVSGITAARIATFKNMGPAVVSGGQNRSILPAGLSALG